MKVEFECEELKGYATIEDAENYTEFHLYIMTCDDDLVKGLMEFMEEFKNENKQC